jgi:hypothetical protein
LKEDVDGFGTLAKLKISVEMQVRIPANASKIKAPRKGGAVVSHSLASKTTKIVSLTQIVFRVTFQQM